MQRLRKRKLHDLFPIQVLLNEVHLNFFQKILNLQSTDNKMGRLYVFGEILNVNLLGMFLENKVVAPVNSLDMEYTLRE